MSSLRTGLQRAGTRLGRRQRWNNLHPSPASSVPPLHRDDENNDRQVAHYHTTPPSEKAVAIILGLGSLSAASYAAASGMRAYNEYLASLPPDEPKEEPETASSTKNEGKPKQESKAPRENIFSQWFDVGSKYYEGGFEDTMTRREAALILGVRESSTSKRIKEAHRKLLILNHPDTGGSTYMAGKINEAKELLLKGKRE